MIEARTLDLLRIMRMSAMAKALEGQLEQGEDYKTLGFEERLGLLVDAEWANRQSKKLQRHIRNAHFSTPSATI